MKTMSLRVKLYLFFTILLVTLTVALVATSQTTVTNMADKIRSSTRENILEIIKHELASTAGQYGEMIGKQMNSAFQIPNTIKSVIESNMAMSPDKRLSRSALKSVLDATIKGNQTSSSIYAHFEPNGYDEKDAFFTGDYDHSSDTGVLELYFYKDRSNVVNFSPIDDSSFKYDKTLDEFGIRASEWYLCSKDNKRSCLMEPYQYEIEKGYTELMTSLVMPLIRNDAFVGVIGVDINLSILENLMKKVSAELFNGQSRVSLLSKNGRVVASSHYNKHITRPLKEAISEHANALVGLHKDGRYFDDGENLYVSYGIKIDAPNVTWALLIELPKKVALKKELELEEFIIEESTQSSIKQITVGVIILVVSIALLMLLIRSVIKPLDEIRRRMHELANADGDLTQKINIDTHAELIDLANGFNAFLSRLKNMVNSLKDVGRQVGKQATDVGNISHQTQTRTLSQYQDIESVVTAMNEMSVSATEVARIAQDASQNASDASNGIHGTQKTLDTAVKGVDALANDMSQASDAISHVAQRSEEINQILEVIRGIAEQTNLLALNAAIEAARAGEQGRGFAVVADEVRTLASRTRESTDEITNMIDALKEGVDSAVNIIGSGVSRASHAVEGTTEANQSLVDVVERIKEIVSGIDQVATAASEQSTVSEEINKNLTHIGDTAKDLQDLAHQVKSSGDELGQQVNTLDNELRHLKT